MPHIVRAEQVAYRYPQNDHGLASTSLTVQAGGRVLITGPSGCGKSTLARCLTGLIPHLKFDTFPIWKYNIPALTIIVDSLVKWEEWDLPLAI